MVYINYVKATIATLLLIILSIMIVLMTYLWVHKMEDNAARTIDEKVSKQLCSCFYALDYANGYVLLVNHCNALRNVSVLDGGRFIYRKDYVKRDEIIRFKFNGSSFNLTYNGCSQLFLQ